jgi:DNA-binding NarL/FixJ family response regulator
MDTVRVLLVCNQLLVRAGIRHLLERAGIVLAGEATTCQEALMLTGRERPDVVVLDLDSPAEALACLEQLAASHESTDAIRLSTRRAASTVSGRVRSCHPQAPTSDTASAKSPGNRASRAVIRGIPLAFSSARSIVTGPKEGRT